MSKFAEDCCTSTCYRFLHGNKPMMLLHMDLFADSTISELTQRQGVYLNSISVPIIDLTNLGPQSSRYLICTGCCTRLFYKYPYTFKDYDVS